MMECVGLGEMAWMILPIYALMLIALLMPLVLFAIFLWKLHRSINWIDTSFIDEQREASKKFINNINSMVETWIEDKKGKK